MKRAHSHGATDEFGYQAAEKVATIYDLHATVLHLLGLPRDAERALRRAVAIDAAPGNDAAVSPMLVLNLAGPLFDLERYSEALQHVETAYERGKAAGHELLVSQALRLRASLHRELGQLASTAQALDELSERLRDQLRGQPPIESSRKP